MQFAHLEGADGISAITPSGLDLTFFDFFQTLSDVLRPETNVMFTKRTSLQPSLDPLLLVKNLSLPPQSARDFG